MQSLQSHEQADLGKGITEPEGRSPTHTVQPQLWFGKELHLLQFHLDIQAWRAYISDCIMLNALHAMTGDAMQSIDPDNCTVDNLITYKATN